MHRLKNKNLEKSYMKEPQEISLYIKLI